MRFRIALAAGALLLGGAAPSAGAQNVVRMIGDDLKYAGQDMWAIWTAPLDGSKQDWLLAAALVAGSHAIMPLDDDIDRWTVRDSASALFEALKPFRRGGMLFQGHTLVPFAGAALVGGYVFKNQDVRDGIYGCAASWLSNNVLRHQVLYRFVRRERPNPYKDSSTAPAREGDQYDWGLSAGDTSWGHNSWPGGHVANITACASFVNHRFNLGYVEPVLWAVAAGVGVGRLADRAHWTSDQIIGAVFGYAIGREVAHRQRKREERRREEGAQAGAAPIPTSPRNGFYLVNDPARGVGLGWQRDF